MKLNINDAVVGGKMLVVLPYGRIIKSSDYDGLTSKSLSFVPPVKLLWQMVATCLTDDGIGLAAPQVGVFKRLFIIRDFTKTEILNTFSPYFNPTWLAVKEDGKSTENEGCLSVVGKTYSVERWNTIEAQWWDWNDLGGAPVHRTERLSGHMARVFQHEYQHLNAISIVDVGTLVP